MAMCYDDAADLVSLLEKVSEIGDDVIDPQHVVLGEHDTGVDDQDVLSVLDGHHVLADLPQPPEGDQSKCFACHRLLTSFVVPGGRGARRHICPKNEGRASSRRDT